MSEIETVKTKIETTALELKKTWVVARLNGELIIMTRVWNTIIMDSIVTKRA